MPKLQERERGNDTLTLNRREVARELRCSERTIDNMHCRGLLPTPRRVGRCVRWLRSEIEEWLRLGCPNREQFELETARRCDNV